MPSIIPGFEYDIFISYRQKDNKGDRWVTNFVEELKTELDSTFKEEVSVYFDINPHDGLLETHDVNASLREKLKCAIFIPVISRTYCDPNSFAWANELGAFVDQANQDSYGMKVKLKGGNVASRVLPVQIHDLDPEDRYLLEKQLGGVMRGIEFIYKEPGVNRPLTNEDDEKINLNRTKYRNQINKVANAIKEIIAGLRSERVTSPANKELSDKPKNLILKGGYLINRLRREAKRTKLRNAIIIILSALLLAAAIFITLRLKNGPDSDKKTIIIEKSIAVLPFRNVSEEQNQENICDGLTIEIINHLYKIKSFDKVVPLGSVFTYKRTEKKIPQIADELKANYIVDGTYRKIGDKVRVTVQLIDPKKDNILWQNEYDKPFKELIAIQADIALQIAGQIKAFITSSEKQSIKKSPDRKSVV